MGIDFKELDKYIKSLQRTKNDFDKFLKEFLLKEAYRIVAQTKQNTPVDTGALRASWLVGNENTRIFSDEKGTIQSDYKSAFAKKASIESIEVTGDNLRITIANFMDYASFVEYGTYKQTGKFMFTKSVSLIMSSMPKRFQADFSAFLKRHKM
ncbi:MAG: HK97 gp10 family phage protein [Anaerovoracaceae bacterium]